MQALLDLDASIVYKLNSFVATNGLGTGLAYAVSLYAVYLIPVIWLVWWFVAGKKVRFNLLSSIFAGIIAWQLVNRVVKLLVERQRPIHDFPYKEILFERPENSFPSDHAAFMSAIAFYFLLKKQQKTGWILLALAIIAGVARVAVAVHYPSDILIGFLDGFLSAWFVSSIHEILTERLWNPLVRLAQKLHLA